MAPALLRATDGSLLDQAPPAHFATLAHTYSIVAFDSATGDLVAVQSKFPNVGGLVPWAKAGVRAVATHLDDILKRHRT